ncbi:MAG: hypothetical protein LBO63_01185 [Oscillospiraceae bacterium]|nr:hypothetical protein [Oscillospiraceae bacterium]
MSKRTTYSDPTVDVAVSNGYIAGFIGALLGALVGAIAYGLIGMLGYISGWIGLLIGLLAVKGYKLFKGKTGGLTTVLIVLAVIFGVVVGQVLSDFATIGKMIIRNEVREYELSDIPSVYADLLKDPEVLRGTLINLGIGLLFSLGFSAVLIHRVAVNIREGVAIDAAPAADFGPGNHGYGPGGDMSTYPTEQDGFYPVISGRTVYTKEVLKKASNAKQTRTVVLVMWSIFSVICVIAAIASGETGAIFIALLIMIILGLILLPIAILAPAIYAKSNKRSIGHAVDFAFSNNEVYINSTLPNSAGQKRMSYSELKLVWETQEQFRFFAGSLYANPQVFFILQKSDITQGTALQLRGILQQQLGAKRFKFKGIKKERI